MLNLARQNGHNLVEKKINLVILVVILVVL